MEPADTTMSHKTSQSPKGNEDCPSQQHQESQDKKRPQTSEAFILRFVASICRLGFLWACGLIHKVSQVLTEPHFLEFFRETKVFLRNHPVASAIVAFIAIACGIPVLIFVAFAIITIFFTFSGFIIIEGAVLVAGSIALLVCLATMAVVFTAVGFLLGLLYITFMHIANIVSTDSVNGEHVQPFDARLPKVLASLRNLQSTNSLRHNHGRGLHSTSSNGHTHIHHVK